MIENSHQEYTESFYSVYSHEEAFDLVQHIVPVPEIEVKSPEFTKKQQIPVRTTLIAKSSINLDDCALDIDQNSHEGERRSYETLATAKRMTNQGFQQPHPMQIPHQQPQQPQPQLYQVHNISQIHPNEPKELDQSICLLKQIDCLSVEQVSPLELQEIKKKIEGLKREQLTLQSSLAMAGEMLKNAKLRNQILEDEVARCRRVEEERAMNKQPSYKAKIEQVRIASSGSQHRYFPQHSPSTSPTSHNSKSLQSLKLLYKECSINDSYCVYQNEGYKIEVLYEREKHVSEDKMLILCVKLTPHHHIVGKKQWRFGLEIGEKVWDGGKEGGQGSVANLSYEGGLIIQQFKSWPEDKFHIIATIHELDQARNHHHTHNILIPLPITHFFEPRLVALLENQLSKVKGSLSEYNLSLTGAISAKNADRAKEMWWFGRFLSCLGWNQLVFMEFMTAQEQESKNQLRVRVYGKSNGKMVNGVIEFLSFFLTD